MAKYAQKENSDLLRNLGFSDANNGVYRPESIAKGWARDAYREGKDNAVSLKEVNHD